MSTSRKSSRKPIPIEPTQNRPALLLLAAGVTLAGLGMAWWSVREISALVASLRTGAPVVETVNIVYVLPVLALAFLALGALFGVEILSRPWAERMGAAVMAVLLATLALVAFFGLAGGILNHVLMTRSGYELCDTRSGTRITWTLWARTPASCAAVADR